MEDRIHSNRIKKGTISFAAFLSTLFLAGVYAVLCIAYLPSANMQSAIVTSWGWISILLMVFSLSSIAILDTWSSTYVLYIITAYFYWMGSLFLKALNIVPINSVLTWFSYEELIHPIIYSVLGFGLLQLAAILSLRKKSGFTVFCNGVAFSDSSRKSAVILTSILLLLISTPIYLDSLIKTAVKSITYGYGAIYLKESVSSADNIISSLSMLFIPGLYLLFSAKKESGIIRKAVLLIVSLSTIVSFLTGLRGQALTTALSFLWLYHVQVKPFKKGSFIKLALLGLIFIIISTTVFDYRRMQGRSISSFFELFARNLLEENFLVTFINELGFSMFPLIKTMQIVPVSHPFAFGFSYLSSFLAIIPSKILGGVSFARYAALDIWLMNYLNLNYGPGYSLVAETYYNFGWFGFLVLMLWGYVLIRMFRNKYAGNKAILHNAFIAIFLYFMLLTPRFPLLLTMRNLFYGVAMPRLMIGIIHSLRHKKDCLNEK